MGRGFVARFWVLFASKQILSEYDNAIGHCPLPIKLELVVTLLSTLNECGQGSKIDSVIARYLWVVMPLLLVSVEPISWLEGEEAKGTYSCHVYQLYFCDWMPP